MTGGGLLASVLSTNFVVLSLLLKLVLVCAKMVFLSDACVVFFILLCITDDESLGLAYFECRRGLTCYSLLSRYLPSGDFSQPSLSKFEICVCRCSLFSVWSGAWCRSVLDVFSKSRCVTCDCIMQDVLSTLDCGGTFQLFFSDPILTSCLNCCSSGCPKVLSELFLLSWLTWLLVTGWNQLLPLLLWLLISRLLFYLL